MEQKTNIDYKMLAEYKTTGLTPQEVVSLIHKNKENKRLKDLHISRTCNQRKEIARLEAENKRLEATIAGNEEGDYET